MLAAVTTALALAGCDVAPARVLSVTLPEDTRDQRGPYVVQAVLSGPLGDDHALLCWSVDGGATVRTTPMSARAGRADLVAAGIPGQSAGTTVGYVVLVHTDGQCPPLDAGDTLASFRVLPAATGCRADSDCLGGREICQAETCRAFTGTCVATGADAGLACPGGTVCDHERAPPLCVIPARPCQADGECALAETCDPARRQCVARAACAPERPCPGDLRCDAPTGLCF